MYIQRDGCVTYEFGLNENENYVNGVKIRGQFGVNPNGKCIWNAWHVTRADWLTVKNSSISASAKEKITQWAESSFSGNVTIKRSELALIYHFNMDRVNSEAEIRKLETKLKQEKSISRDLNANIAAAIDAFIKKYDEESVEL